MTPDTTDGGGDAGGDTAAVTHVAIELPAGAKAVAREALRFRVAPAANWTFFDAPENWRGGRQAHVILWGPSLDAATLRELGNAGHTLEKDRSQAGLHEAAAAAREMERAFIEAETEVPDP